IAGLVRDVAGVAAHIERGVAAAALRDIHSLVVAGETKVLLRGRTGRRLQELVLVVGSVRIVALDAIPNCGTVDVALDLGGILIAVALEAELNRGGGDQSDVGDVPVRPDLVAA